MQRNNKRFKLTLNRINCLTILIYFLMFVSKDTFFFGTNKSYAITNIPILVMNVYICLELLRNIKIKRSTREQTILLSGIIFIIIYIMLVIYHKELLQVAMVKLLCIVSAMFFTMHFSFDEYTEAFTRVMVFNAIAAIILEIIVYLLPAFAAILPRMTNSAGVQICNIGFAGMASYELNAAFVRAFGIFWEPGVFQIYLNLAIIFELFRRHTINWKRITVLIIGVLITFSTSGYIITGWVMISYILLTKKNTISSKTIVMFFILLVATVLVFVFVDLSYVSQTVFGKLTDEESGSTIARQASVFVNLQIFFDYPFTGIGMKSIQDEFILRSGRMFIRSSRHNTNTLLYQFAAHGIFYGGMFLFGTYRMTHCLTEKKMLRFALFVSLILLYVGENLRYSMLPYIIMFYGYGTLRKNRSSGGNNVGKNF